MRCVQVRSLFRIVASLTAGFVSAWALGVPTEILPDDGAGDGTGLPGYISSYDWKEGPPLGPINQNALRFVDPDYGVDDFTYIGETDDPWITDSLVSYLGTGTYDFGVLNKTNSNNGETFDGLILLIAYRGSDADFTFQLNGETFGDGNFNGLDEYDNLFDPAGNRPGDGQAALFKGAEGVMFVDLGPDSAVGPGDIADIDLVLGGSLPGDFALNFNAYGYIDGSVVVTDTNPNSGDLTVAVPEASTLILFGGGLIGILGFLKRKAPFLAGR